MTIELVSAVPDDRVAAEVLALADAIERSDGSPPLSDQTRTRLRSDEVRHLVVRDDTQLIGYAQIGDGAVEIAAETDAVDEVLDAAIRGAEGSDLVWSHGQDSRLVRPLERRGFSRTRELFQLRRPATIPLPADPPLADDIAVRTFVVDQDEQAWLELNAAAFAAHAEQGRMTLADLRARTAESWFDPAGFLLAERDGELLGFHWTKVHPDGGGEVYVLGVSPDGQGLGLGGALLIRGLRHLHERGCPYVLLYVDGDNPGALHLYERDGFARHDVDVQWST